MLSSIRYPCMQNIELLSSILQNLTLDLEGWPFTTLNVQLHEICMNAKYQVAIFNIAKLTFDLNLEGWPWPFTTQNVQLHEIHMHATYQVTIFDIAKLDLWPWPFTLKDDLDLNLSPLKICSSMRYTCMANIKLLSSILQKLWAMLKFSDGRTNGRTDWRTDRLTVQKLYATLQGHKKVMAKIKVFGRTDRCHIFDLWP